jgi:hypothetical protein
MSTQFDPRPTATAVVVQGLSRAHAPATTTATATSTRGLTWIDRLTLVAIALVVVLVTLPVLRRFGVRENERDALRMLRILSAEPASGGRRGATTLADLAAVDTTLARRLEDLERLDDGRLRRHGYLFDVAQLRSGEPVLLAWPWEHGQTGLGAFAWTPRRGVIGHANRDGRYSGPEAAIEPGDLLAGEWVGMPRR